VSAVPQTDLDREAPPARRPGTPTRFLLFLSAAAGSAVVLTIGFPAGAPDRLPVLLLSLALALDAVFRTSRAIRDFCYLLPVVGLLASIFGSADAVAWPVLLFGGLAVGWTFRFLYDFESRPEASRLDRPLRALVAIWTLGTTLALVRARTIWALVHGLSGRAVNGEGLPDAAAIRESLLTFAILATGAGFFFILRRSGEKVRAECIRAALIGVALSAAAAILQAAGVFPDDTRPFWKLTGRLSGGATDPNALGLLCGLGIVVLLALAIGWRERWAIWTLLPLPFGLSLSGSRSGFLIAILGSAAIIALASLDKHWRAALAVGALGLALAIAFLPQASVGGVGGRVRQLFRSALSLDDRTSSRPILWRAAVRLFADSPIEGGGVGSFSWQLPDVAAAQGNRLPMRDNPGSAYLQALAETGIVGLALTLAFVLALGRQALARTREPGSSGAGAGLLAFLIALLVGSHWLAPEVSILFFLLSAQTAIGGEPRSRTKVLLTVALMVLYTVSMSLAAARTADPRETFRYSRLIGFHRLEAGPGGHFRWTKKKFAIWVDRAAPEQLSLANYSPEGKPVGMTVRADDGILYRHSVRPGEAVHLALWSGGRARPFRFELDRAFVPKRLTGSDDRRELGLLAVLPEDRSAHGR